MDIEIYNQSLECIGIVDTFNSLIWDRKFYEAGMFELYTAIDKNALLLLQEGNIVVKPDSIESGIITSLNIDNATNCITAQGCFLSGLLSRRYITGVSSFTGSAEATMRSLVKSSAIDNNPIPFLQLGTLANFDDTLDCFTDNNNLHDYLSALAQATEIGFRIRKDGTALKFECYKGTNRSIEQSDNPQVEFTRDSETLLTATYSKDTSGSVNVVTAFYDDDENNHHESVTVGTETGFSRRELRVQGNYENDESGNYSQELTENKLTQLATDSLVKATENFTGSVDCNSSYIYKTDYDLGDIVTVTESDWNKSVSSRICEVREVYDSNNNMTITPTFGTPGKTIADILKQRS